MPIVPHHRYDRPYHPRKETLEFFIWFSQMFDEENRSAPMHYQMVDFINGKKKKKVVECTRGASKSTLIGVYYLIYCIWRGKKYNHGDVNVIVYIMDSVQKAAAQISRILYTIEDTPQLNEILKITRSTMGNDPTIEFYNKAVNRRIKLVGRGSGQSVRGINFMNKRPDWIIFDDIESEESAGTKENRDKLKQWFFGNVIPAGIPSITEYTFIGTPLHADALLMNLVESETWEAIQLPIAEEFPVDKDKIISCWEDRFTPDHIVESYQSYKDLGQTALWFQEHMLIVTPSEALLYNIDNIKRYKSTDLKDKMSKLTYYISLDLAVSEKSGADYTVIAVIGVNENNHWFLVDGIYKRGMQPDETINKLFEYVVRYRPYTVVFEKVAFQMAMKTFINNEMLKRGIFFNLEMVARTTQKLSVLKAFQPIVELGRFWIPEDIMKNFTEELLDEMRMITQDKILAKHDDLIDAISQLTLIEIISTTPIQESQFLDNNEHMANPYIF